MSSKVYEERDYALDMDSLTIRYKSHVSYPRKSALFIKGNHLKPTLKRKKIFTLNFVLLVFFLQILKLEMTIFMIHNC